MAYFAHVSLLDTRAEVNNYRFWMVYSNGRHH